MPTNSVTLHTARKIFIYLLTYKIEYLNSKLELCNSKLNFPSSELELSESKLDSRRKKPSRPRLTWPALNSNVHLKRESEREGERERELGLIDFESHDCMLS